MVYMLCLIIFLKICLRAAEGELETSFPDGFEFGLATSAYQVEGAWQLNGKGESIWDHLVHNHPDQIADQSTGDVASNSYHKYKEDVQLLKHLGVHFYRFSISWSRIFPTADSHQVNIDGVRYYNDLIDELLANGIQPMVTLYHWDLPQWLQERGGFTSPIFSKHFVDYANFVFENYGNRVKVWSTFNDPLNICVYGMTTCPPENFSPSVDYYNCGHNVLKAHAQTYHLYNDTFRAKQNGRVSIDLGSNWHEPNTTSKEDVEAAERNIQFDLGWWASPIFSEQGDYPRVMKETIKRKSTQEGRPSSRLPEFTNEEVEYIKGTYDYFGYNYYTTDLVSNNQEDGPDEFSFEKDAGIKQTIDPNWPSSASPWLKVVPWGLRKMLNWIMTRYGKPEIMILENGYSDKGELDDPKRIRFYELYLESLLQAIHNDKVNVTKYTAWSVVDNFEWTFGYTQKFGLYHVDFSDPDRKRTIKKSGQYYKEIVSNRRLIPSNLTFWNDAKQR